MAKVNSMREASARLEAALYSAGRPLRVEELIRASGTESRTKTMQALEAISKSARSAFRAIEIARLPDGSYVLQLKPEYSSTIRRYASKPLLSNATLRTLSYIALEQPVSSKQLVEVRGSGVYAHLRELRQQDFVRHENVGRFKIYSTTEKFQKYFGIEGGTDSLKALLLGRMGRRSAKARSA